jgi:hypothetical protein
MKRRMFAVMFSVLLAGILSCVPVFSQTVSSQDGVQALLLAPLNLEYQTAVVNAQANLLHIQNPPANPDIWDITADNKNLLWSGEPGKSQVLVTSFTKASYYSSYQTGQTLSAGADLWVTPAPQAYRDVKAEDPYGVAMNPKLALSQYLGLPPTNSNDSVVSLWVSPANLVRPAIDPTITNHELETSFAVTMQSVPLTATATVPKEAPAPGFGPTTDYTTWFLNRESAIFSPAIQGGPYPWTGLGYTYDWNPVATDVVGGSEFIIPKGSPVTVNSVTPVSKFFN